MTTKASFDDSHQTYEIDPYLAEIARIVVYQQLSEALFNISEISIDDIAIRIEHDGKKDAQGRMRKIVTITNPDAPYVVDINPIEGSDNAATAIRKRGLDLKADIKPSMFRPDAAITVLFAHRYHPWEPYASAILHCRDWQVQSSLSMDGVNYKAYRGTETAFLIDRTTRPRYFVDASNLGDGILEIRIFVADYKYDFTKGPAIIEDALKKYGLRGIEILAGTRTVKFQVDTIRGTVASTSNILRALEENEALVYVDYRPTDMFRDSPGKFASLKASNISPVLGSARGRGFQDRTIDNLTLAEAFPFDLGNVSQNPDINVVIAPAEFFGDSDYGRSVFHLPAALSRCPQLITSAAQEFIQEQEGSIYTIPGFRLETRVERGAYKSVWNAVDQQGTPYIVQVLDPDEAAIRKMRDARLTMEDLVDNEAMLRAASEKSPHVGILLGIKGDGQTRDGKRVYYFVERPYKKTLKEKYTIGQKAILSDMLKIGLQLTDAISAGHDLSEPLIHSDVKDANIALTEEGDIRVLDYGIARRLRESIKETKQAEWKWIGSIDTSPAELYEADVPKPNERTDVFSIGCVLFKLATGYHPFSPRVKKPSFDDPVRVAYEKDTIKNKLQSDYSHLFTELKYLPEELAAIVIKAMHRDPSKRYENATEMKGDIKRIVDLDAAYNDMKGKVLEEARGTDPKLYVDPHLQRTLDWLLILNPSASYSQRLAAVVHDYERICDEAVQREDEDSYPEYKVKHAKQAAQIAQEMAQAYTTNQEFIHELVEIVAHHDDKQLEAGHSLYNSIQDVIDADGLSFFQVNLDAYILGSSPEDTKEKAGFMYERMSGTAKELLHEQPFFEKAKQYLDS